MDQKAENLQANKEDALNADNYAIASNNRDLEVMKEKQRAIKERNTKHWHDELARSRDLENMKPKET